MMSIFKTKRVSDKNLWLIGAGCLLAVAGAVYLVRKTWNRTDEKPPKGAPQLNLDNPGSQHDFPKSPIESEIG